MRLMDFFMFDEEERTQDEQKCQAFFRECSKHLTKARNKHPFFAKKVLSRNTEIANEFLAQKHKKDIIANGYALEDVLTSELHEFLVEAHKGDMKRAREEAADIVAVLLRFCLGDMELPRND